jgi:hypothetical protein
MCALQACIIKNLDTGLEMRIDDFDRLAHIAADEPPPVSAPLWHGCVSAAQRQPSQLLCVTHQLRAAPLTDCNCLCAASTTTHVWPRRSLAMVLAQRRRAS